MTIWWWSDYLIKTKPNCRQPHQGLEALRAWRQRNEELCCAQTTEEADWKKSRANGSHGSGTLQKGSRPICPLLELWWGFLPDFCMVLCQGLPLYHLSPVLCTLFFHAHGRASIGIGHCLAVSGSNACCWQRIACRRDGEMKKLIVCCLISDWHGFNMI